MEARNQVDKVKYEVQVVLSLNFMAEHVSMAHDDWSLANSGQSYTGSTVLAFEVFTMFSWI